MSSRKRPRVDASDPFADVRTPRASSNSNGVHDLDASTSSLGVASPSPLVNTDYRFFGGLYAPGTWSEQREECARMEDEERDYRQNRYSERPPQQSYFDNQLTSQQTQATPNGETPSATLSGWHLRKTAWALTGGLAGKIFNFCWNTTFRGFQAGGGQAYPVKEDKGSDLDCSKYTDDPPPDLFQSRPSIQTQTQPHPHYDQQLHKTPVSYQRHTPDDSIVRNNWVFVETTPNSPEEHSPVRKRYRTSVAGSMHTHMPPPPQPSRTRSTASFASPRARTTSLSSRSYTYTYGGGGGSGGSGITTTAASTTSPKPKRPRVSMASPRQNQAARQHSPAPASPEIETFRRKRRKQQRRQDESLGRINATLRDMIREAQQALGSKIEIVDADADAGGGYVSADDDDDDGDDNDEYDADEGYFGDGGSMR